VQEGGVARRLAVLVGERAGVLARRRGAAEDEHGLALDVEAGVVVIEGLVAVLGRDAVAGEDHRHAVERPAAADAQGGEIGLGPGLDLLVVGAGGGQLLGLAQPGVAADGERLEVAVGAAGGLQPGLAEGGGDVVGGRLDPRGARAAPLAGVVGQVRHVGLQAGRHRADVLGGRPRPPTTAARAASTRTGRTRPGRGSEPWASILSARRVMRRRPRAGDPPSSADGDRF
jgi:hypothetical protein